MHVAFTPSVSSNSRRRTCARASCDFEKLAVPPSSRPISACGNLRRRAARRRSGGNRRARASARSRSTVSPVTTRPLFRQINRGRLQSPSPASAARAAMGERTCIRHLFTVMLRTQPANTPRPSYWSSFVSTSTNTSCTRSSAAATFGTRRARVSAPAFGMRGKSPRVHRSRRRAPEPGFQGKVAVEKNTHSRDRCASRRKGRGLLESAPRRSGRVSRVRQVSRASKNDGGGTAAVFGEPCASGIEAIWQRGTALSVRLDSTPALRPSDMDGTRDTRPTGRGADAGTISARRHPPALAATWLAGAPPHWSSGDSDNHLRSG